MPFSLNQNIFQISLGMYKSTNDLFKKRERCNILVVMIRMFHDLVGEVML